jgi:hypothetical protein
VAAGTVFAADITPRDNPSQCIAMGLSRFGESGTRAGSDPCGSGRVAPTSGSTRFRVGSAAACISHLGLPSRSTNRPLTVRDYEASGSTKGQRGPQSRASLP